MRLFIITLFCLVGIDSVAQSAQPKTYALIVGLSEYKEIAPLQFADRDATAFAGFLTTQHVPEANIKLFLNQEATRLNILDELSSLTQTLNPHDRFYFYFGGHGDLEAKIGAENALLLLYYSYKSGYFKGNEYLQLSELKSWFDALAKKQVEVIFIADACHSGGLIGGKDGVSKTQQALQARWAGITKLLSCRADEYSLEGKQWGGGRGLFSYHLVNGLTGRADANQDKRVSLKELNTYLTSNVVKEANPNVQTPVVLGDAGQLLAAVSEEGLAELAAYEQRNFPIITEVNLKGDNEKATAELMSKLDTSLVNAYKRFSKALKEKRVSVYDDSTDNALLYYRRLTARSIPANLIQLMKRNLVAGLMDRELSMMRAVREKGEGRVYDFNTPVTPAIRNLEEALKLFGPSHYIYPLLQARILVLQSQILPKQKPLSQTETIDQNRKQIQDFYQQMYTNRQNMLLAGLRLEPNMISTYALLSSVYQDKRLVFLSKTNNQQLLDSALYYQQKVVDLLPNQSSAWLNLANTYRSMQGANDRPNPKTIDYYLKAIALDSTSQEAYLGLGYLSRGADIHATYHDYPQAIRCLEKVVSFYETKDQAFLAKGIDSYTKELNSEEYNMNKNNYVLLLHGLIELQSLHKVMGDTKKADSYFDRFTQKADILHSAYGYGNAFIALYTDFQWSEDESDLSKALNFQQKTLERTEDNIKVAPAADKPLQTLKYRELLKGIGVTNRALKNYDEAEKYLQQAMVYPVLDGPFTGKLKLIGSSSVTYQNRLLLVPGGTQKMRNGDYHYRIEANAEMFFIKWEQHKPDEAFAWLEKAFQQSVVEHGNDVTGQSFEQAIFEAYKDMDQQRYKTLKAKYFPPTTDKK